MNINGFTEKNINGVFYLESDLLSSLNVRHMFAERFGGKSEGDFCSLNVSFSRKNHMGDADSKDRVLENYRIALSVLNTSPERSAAANQVHSNNILCVSEKNRGANIIYESTKGEDALILKKSVNGIDTLCVKTADCVPVLLYDRASKNIAAVHAGWRGSVNKILPLCVERLCEKKDFSNLFAAIGPCIGKCCYEVGEEVSGAALNALCNKELYNDVCRPKKNGKFMLDISLLNKYLLMKIGVPMENIAVCPYKTCCAENGSGEFMFFSHRRSGGFSGTFLSAIKKTD